MTASRPLKAGDEISFGKFSLFFKRTFTEPFADPVTVAPAQGRSNVPRTYHVSPEEAERLNRVIATKRRAQIEWEVAGAGLRGAHHIEGDRVFIGQATDCDVRVPAGPARDILIVRGEKGFAVESLAPWWRFSRFHTRPFVWRTYAARVQASANLVGRAEGRGRAEASLDHRDARASRRVARDRGRRPVPPRRSTTSPRVGCQEARHEMGHGRRADAVRVAPRSRRPGPAGSGAAAGDLHDGGRVQGIDHERQARTADREPHHQVTGVRLQGPRRGRSGRATEMGGRQLPVQPGVRRRCNRATPSC